MLTGKSFYLEAYCNRQRALAARFLHFVDFQCYDATGAILVAAHELLCGFTNYM